MIVRERIEPQKLRGPEAVEVVAIAEIDLALVAVVAKVVAKAKVVVRSPALATGNAQSVAPTTLQGGKSALNVVHQSLREVEVAVAVTILGAEVVVVVAVAVTTGMTDVAVAVTIPGGAAKT